MHRDQPNLRAVELSDRIRTVLSLRSPTNRRIGRWMAFNSFQFIEKSTTSSPQIPTSLLSNLQGSPTSSSLLPPAGDNPDSVQHDSQKFHLLLRDQTGFYPIYGKIQGLQDLNHKSGVFSRELRRPGQNEKVVQEGNTQMVFPWQKALMAFMTLEKAHGAVDRPKGSTWKTKVLSPMTKAKNFPTVLRELGRWPSEGLKSIVFELWSKSIPKNYISKTITPTMFIWSPRIWSMTLLSPTSIYSGSSNTFYHFDPIKGMNDRSEEKITNKNETELNEQKKKEMKDMIENGESEPKLDTIEEAKRTTSMENYLSKYQKTETGDRKGRDDARIVNFIRQLTVPGVVEFSLCLFFAKLVAYTFLFWLPMYIKHSTDLDPADSAYLSTMFDFGGIAGGIAAGVLSDRSGMPAITCATLLILSIPTMAFYLAFADTSLGLNIFLLLIMGFVVNGPYALITTAVSAELGTHESLRGNSKALATVTAIIDGTGSVGSAIGPQMTGPLSKYSWDYIFYMLIVSAFLALLLTTLISM
ncbi:unnamed protein product, partial [Meganyctiphanes norvegica]